MCDQSPYSIEERLIAAVWMHDRVRDKKKIPEVRRMFQQRFDKQAPTARILREWEKKLFETGSVLDAPRCGRPATRMMHIAAVRESILRSPQKSFRKRSAELQIPHTTLQKIMKMDLQVHQHQLQQLPQLEQHLPQLQVVQEVTVTDQESEGAKKMEVVHFLFLNLSKLFITTCLLIFLWLHINISNKIYMRIVKFHNICISASFQNKLQELEGIKLMPHPEYSPDLVSLDYHVFHGLLIAPTIL